LHRLQDRAARLPGRDGEGNFRPMSAAEIIEKIKALPPEEQRQVSRFVRAHMDAGRPSGGVSQPATICYAADEQARAAGDAIVAEFPETFRRLAE